MVFGGFVGNYCAVLLVGTLYGIAACSFGISMGRRLAANGHGRFGSRSFNGGLNRGNSLLLQLDVIGSAAHTAVVVQFLQVGGLVFELVYTAVP